MTARKTKRNAPLLKRDGGFQICRKAVVHVTPDEQVQDLGGNYGLPRAYGSPLLFVIARDPNTIFASWSIDWQSVFEKVTPVDRQVHLRVYGVDGSEEQKVTVEPMASMHYVTTSQLHSAYRVDIGYFQPADVWHSIAISNEVLMPPNKIAESFDVDLATIPFHLSFQQLLDALGSTDPGAVAKEIAQFQKCALSDDAAKQFRPDKKKILRNFGVSLHEIAAARRVFNSIDTEKLATRTRRFLTGGPSSPSRGFDQSSWDSYGTAASAGALDRASLLRRAP